MRFIPATMSDLKLAYARTKWLEILEEFLATGEKIVRCPNDGQRVNNMTREAKIAAQRFGLPVVAKTANKSTFLINITKLTEDECIMLGLNGTKEGV